ncbi:hypothetical protein R70723_26835 [Paenibacillus sp. FSL R7-0273]|nr:hypothetical protein R70723_26835 [Paenibacillus sp. FSL R7-0273]OMF87198.1 hypothetical protein BK144_24515 [Paenibacillus sp. FSL R7-0273]
MDEREPKWYEQARKGPFQEEKFTASSAEQVMRRLHAEAEPSRPRTRQRLRLGIMTAVIFLVLAGGGALYLNNGPQDGVNTAGVTVPAEEQTELSDDALKKIAEQLIRKQLGRDIPFKKLEHVQNTENVQLEYREYSKAYALVGINAKTGETKHYTINAALDPEATDNTLIDEARDKLLELGYKGNFEVTGSTLYVDYGRTANKSIQVQNVITAADAAINFANGVFKAAYFDVELNEVSEEMKQTALQGLRLISGGGEEQLNRAVRIIIEGMPEEITLIYGPVENITTAVAFNYATGALLDVYDNSLSIIDTTDLKYTEEEEEQLLKMDSAKLRSAAAAIADKLYGIRLEEDYRMDKNGSRPGVVTFESRSGAPAFEVSYNLEGSIYSFIIKRDSNTLY